MASSRTAIQLARWLGYLSEEEVGELKRVIKANVPKLGCVVNLGVGGGTTSMAVMEASKEALLALSLYSVDRERQPFANEESFLREAGLWSDRTLMQIVGESQDIGNSWPKIHGVSPHHAMVDAVIVDAGHFYEEVVGDIDAWIPKIRDGGIIVFHDYGSVQWGGVKLAVDKYVLTTCELIGHVDTLISFKVNNENA